ncbi:MAG: glycine cleavage system protein, partial [Actinomycetota bacterium]|nr:glycine cleavage system protein [Actinomycetota bacterium]
MSLIPPDLRYTREHEWASLGDDGKVKVGITDFAQSRLGDVVFLDLPEPES